MKKLDEISNENSCLNKSKENEPIFVLCARDPIAAKIVRLWAYIRIGEFYNTAGDNKINEALKLADEMEKFRLTL